MLNASDAGNIGWAGLSDHWPGWLLHARFKMAASPCRAVPFGCALILGLGLTAAASPASANPLFTPAQMPGTNMAQPCALGMVERPDAPRLWRATAPDIWRATAPGLPLDAGNLRLTYLGHSSFVIETPGGASGVSDYNGVHRPPFVPDVVTMNNAHSTHFTDVPDPAIGHVLRGWNYGSIGRHDASLKDLRVFNVPTNLTAFSGVTQNGNSIFIYQAAGLCIAHLGHLRHLVGADIARAMGRIDVLLIPIDNGSTVSHTEAVEAIAEIAPRLAVPMHYHWRGAGESFVAAIGGRYPVRTSPNRTIMLNRRDLPRHHRNPLSHPLVATEAMPAVPQTLL
ncbi:MAG: MBL fold metallo-hydrolase [Proteobacteria bacterium]|nr:MBL fold metallo-hydrolase [Pseudomonadota bacterium]